MAGMMDFLFGRGALKQAVASSQDNEDGETKKRKRQQQQQADESEGVGVNASAAADLAQAKLKQEALKKAVKGRSKGGYSK